MNLETHAWKVVVLEHDTASEQIGKFFEKVWADGIIRKKMYNEDWSITKSNLIREVQEIFKDINVLGKKILTLYGDGNRHHFTYGLCTEIARKKSENYMYLQIDNHTDSIKNNDSLLYCGAFVEDILEDAGAGDVLLIGAENGTNNLNRKLLSQTTLTSDRAKEELKIELKEKLLKNVYASLDLDLLKNTEILTSYGQGILRLCHLLDIIKTIKEEKNIISADILGYTNNLNYNYQIHYLNTDPASLLTYAALAAKITGRDTKELEKLHSYFKTRRIRPNYINEFEKITEQLKI